MKVVLIFFIRTYRLLISPLLPPSCRFTPTCSEYAMQAIEKYGAVSNPGGATETGYRESAASSGSNN